MVGICGFALSRIESQHDEWFMSIPSGQQQAFEWVKYVCHEANSAVFVPQLKIWGSLVTIGNRKLLCAARVRRQQCRLQVLSEICATSLVA